MQRKGKWPRTAVFAGIVACLLSCEYERSSGNTSEVVNPVVVAVWSDGHREVFGHRVEAYAASHNPLEDSTAWFNKTLGASGRLPFTEGVARFNLLLEDLDGDKGFAWDLAWEAEGRRFLQGGVPVETLLVRLQPPASYQGSVSGDSLIQVFLPGTPYRAKVARKTFRFGPLVPGAFPMRMLAASWRVYATESLSTAQPASFAAAALLDSVPPSRRQGIDSAQSAYFTLHPKDASARVNASVTFQCAAAGTPPLSFEWLRNNSLIDSARSDSLLLPVVSKADSGARFRVVVINAHGTDTSNVAILRVSDTLAAPPRP